MSNTNSLMAVALVAIAVLAPLPALGHVKVSDRDKTGTRAPWQNEASSQTVVSQQLASLAFTEAEGKGLEPSTGYPATDFESVSSPFGYPPGEYVYIAFLLPREKWRLSAMLSPKAERAARSAYSIETEALAAVRKS